MSSCLFPRIPLMFMCRKVVKAIMKVRKRIDRCIAPGENDGRWGFIC